MALQNSSESVVLPRTRGHAARGGTGARALPADAGDQLASAARSVAQVISHAASPPVVSTACAFAAASVESRPGAYLAAALFALVGVVLPLVALLRQWRSGEVADLELTRRGERLWPLLLTSTCVGAAACLLLLIGAPVSVAGLAAILGVQSLALLAVTYSWKISVHVAAVAAAAAMVWELTGHWQPGLALVALMVWSRLLLRRHTPLQCLAGAVLGAGLMTVLWPLLAG